MVTPKELVLAQFPGRVYITLVEAGRAIGLKAQTSYNLHQLGRFPLLVRKIGRKPMVSLVDLMNFMAGDAAKTPAESRSPPLRRGRGRPRNADRG